MFSLLLQSVATTEVSRANSQKYIIFELKKAVTEQKQTATNFLIQF